VAEVAEVENTGPSQEVGFITGDTGIGDFYGYCNPTTGVVNATTDEANVTFEAAIAGQEFYDDTVDVNGPAPGTPVTGAVDAPSKIISYISVLNYEPYPPGGGAYSPNVTDGSIGGYGTAKTGYATCPNPCTLFTPTVTCYVYAGAVQPTDGTPTGSINVEQTNAVFDSYGDSVALNEWTSFGGDATLDGSSYFSDQFSDVSGLAMTVDPEWSTVVPNMSDGDGGYDDGTATIIAEQGYDVTDACFLFDYSEAFEFVG
jgi:hypothetical protein